jgi:hypothetical protein
MRPLLAVGIAAAAVAAGVALGVPTPSPRPLPLHAPAAATPPLLALASGERGSLLERLDPATFTVRVRSARVGWWNAWTASPDRRLLAVAVSPPGSKGDSSMLRFANEVTLRWVRRGVALDGWTIALAWPRPGTVQALVGGGSLLLDTVDAVAKKVVARTTIPGLEAAVARSADGLVLLGVADNEIGPATLRVIDAGGNVRSVRLDRIRAGTHFDRASQDPIGVTRGPGLAVDAERGVAYVVDPDGLVAEVRLADLHVSYHELARSPLARLSSWLEPSAAAKGLDGPVLTAQWLGDGLLAVTGARNAIARLQDGSTSFSTSPLGLRVIDTRDWSERMLDTRADSAVVADGLLLATGGTWSSDSSSPVTGEGLAAYGPDASLRWRLEPGTKLSVVAATGSRALVQAYSSDQAPQPLRLVDLASGRVLRSLPADAEVRPLVGPGS